MQEAALSSFDSEHVGAGGHASRAFGGNRLDMESLRLELDGRAVTLGPLPARILDHLIAARGRVVTRGELKRLLWPGSERIDTERRLNTAMRGLREVLGDEVARPRFIETIRGRGYRWVYTEAGGQGRRRAARGAWLTAGAVAVAMLLASFAPAPPFDLPLSALAQAELLQAASVAEERPGLALRRLDAVVLRAPNLVAAHRMRARLAVENWREIPTAANLEAAETRVREARRALGGAQDIRLLDAELALLGRADVGRAEGEYRRVLARDAGNGEARKGLAWVWLHRGRADLAVGQAASAAAGEDLSADDRAAVGWLLLRAGRADLAAALCSGPGAASNLLACRHTADARRGRWVEARAAGLALMRGLGAKPVDVEAVAALDGRRGYERFLSWQADHFADDGRLPAFQKAQIMAAAGRDEQALALLETAVTNGDPGVLKLATTREFDGLRDTARFAVLERAARRTLRQDG